MPVTQSSRAAAFDFRHRERTPAAHPQPCGAGKPHSTAPRPSGHKPPALRLRRPVFGRAACVLALCLGGGLLQAADLSVSVKGVASDSGQVMLALYADEAEFLKSAHQSQRTVASARDAQGSLRFVFKDLPPGRYAVSGFHDRNGNGELDSNLFGVPSEPLGFSNGATSFFGPPGFAKAAITVGSVDQHIDIPLQ